MKTLHDWVAFLTHTSLPILKQTARDLQTLHEQDDDSTVNHIAPIIARDPVMTVKLIQYLQKHKRFTQTTEILQIEQALLMLGIESFFTQVPLSPCLEDSLKSHLAALPPVLRVIHRSHRASEYAKEWAVRLRDLHFEEVRIAALLHDIAEILMWCFAPDEMLVIYHAQHQDRSLRSRDIQTQIFGFPLIELQKELALQWQLPKLLLTLMDDGKATHPRVRNVILAVNLARHSANGWDDAALDDDYQDIAQLLRLSAHQVRSMVHPEPPPALSTDI